MISSAQMIAFGVAKYIHGRSPDLRPLTGGHCEGKRIARTVTDWSGVENGQARIGGRANGHKSGLRLFTPLASEVFARCTTIELAKYETYEIACEHGSRKACEMRNARNGVRAWPPQNLRNAKPHHAFLFSIFKLSRFACGFAKCERCETERKCPRVRKCEMRNVNMKGLRFRIAKWETCAN